PAGPPEARNETPQLITLSAKTQPALDKMSRNLTRFFEENPGINLADAAYTLQVGRAAFAYRRTVTATSAGEIIAAFSPGSDLSPIVQVKEENKPVVFMFPGQGTQYVNMGLDLYKTEPVFREEMERCFEILKESGLDIKAILYPEQHSTAPASGSSVANSDPINNTAFAQPLIFAVQYALAKLLMSWGIKPYAMTGHSIGEYTAACLSGVFSLEDALALVAERGKLMQRMPAGDMLSVSLSKKELTPLLSKHKELSLAAENSPSLCVVSGPAAAIGFLSKELEEKEYKHRLLHTSHAFHSAMMEPVLKDFAKKIAGVKLNKPQIPYISNVTGTWITVQQAADPGYWTGQLRQTVRFAAGLTGLLKEKQPVFLEVGAGRVLSTFAHQHEEKKPHHLILHLIRGPKESESLTDDYFLLSKIGRLWQEGIEIDRQGFYAGQERKRVSLPVYAFERRPYWTAGSLTAPGAKAPAAHFQADSPKEEAKTGTGEGLSPAAGDEASLPLPAAPGKKTEAALLTLWQDFFGVAEIGPRDDFFEIGGDSLKAMTLISHIHKVLNIKVPLTDFFAAATIKKVAEFIDGSSGSVDYSTIEPVEKKEYYPVSPMQGRMLFLNKMDPSSVSYNLSFIHVLDGNIDEEKVKKIFQRLTGRHESFRVCFEIIAGEPVQRIHDTVDFDIEHFEINHSSRDRQAGSSSKQEQDALIDRTVRSFIRPFDLSKAPLLRAGLIKINEAGAIRYILMLDMHHIISDGISNGIFFKELMASYRGEELPPLRIQYKDYTEWYNKELDSGWMKSQETYWLDLFKEEPPLLDLPTDFDRPAKKSYDGRWMVFDIEKEKIERLKALALEEKATMFMVFLAIYYVFLSKLSGQEDITVVTILTGRNHSDLEQIIGMFANTLFLRNYPARDRTFREFLHEVRDRILAAYENQDYQTDTLVDKIVSQREQSRNPISDVSFMLLDFEGPRTPGAKEGKETQEAREVKEAKGEAPAPQVGSYDFQRGDTLFDLSLILGEIGERMFFRFEYSTKLFKRETIIRFEKYFKDILDILLENKDIKLIDIQLEHDLLKAESNIHEMDFEL
ncbi:MAG: acyltransferase domain-containing protein, partial [Candidatus Aminicenantes bacterium]|nr:acyltransferase domain-containing protein [Candidatus Aminicenantes bacterium]